MAYSQLRAPVGEEPTNTPLTRTDLIATCQVPPARTRATYHQDADLPEGCATRFAVGPSRPVKERSTSHCKVAGREIALPPPAWPPGQGVDRSLGACQLGRGAAFPGELSVIPAFSPRLLSGLQGPGTTRLGLMEPWFYHLLPSSLRCQQDEYRIFKSS